MNQQPMIACPQCQEINNFGAPRCERCGAALPAPPVAPQMAYPGGPMYGAPVAQDTLGGGLIPYKNQPALLSYYLGIFSIIPVLGIFMGIAAFFLGLKGLKHAKEFPQQKGATHAWVGIITGALFGWGGLLLGLVIIIAMMTSKH